MKNFCIITAFFFTTIFNGNHPLFAINNKTLVKITKPTPQHLEFESFRLQKSANIQIQAVGLLGKKDDDYLAYGWLIDGESRRIVWNFDNESAIRENSNAEIFIHDEIILPEGFYEVYYFYFPVHQTHSKSILKSFLGQLQVEGKYDNEELGLVLTCLNNDDDCEDVHLNVLLDDSQTIVQMIENGDESYQKQGFSLSGEMDLRIYAIGEGNTRKREMYDYAWIMEAKSRERVWEMTTQNSDYAGGADKNLIFDDIITLPRGEYIVYFVSDDSHSYAQWNSLPPSDPRYWGITIWGASVGDKGSVVKSLEYDSPQESAIVDMTRMRNNEFKNQGFTLKRPARLRIYALGESSSRGEFADYGWIIDAHTREKVWQMRREDTKYAGGSRKNLLFDGIIVLPAGDYIAYYITDDSHAYRSWNDGPPFNPTAWGITIWGADDDFQKDWVSEYHESKNPGILAQIIRVGNDEKIKEKFNLDERTTIRIYALGEGDRSRMYDYAWIEDERGRTVWEMSYRKTDHAGGARKNRVINEIFTLKSGTYTVIYKTDDSHSYNNWNLTPPDDPIHWGITIMSEDFR